jgi:predicted metal-binding membrane protein
MDYSKPLEAVLKRDRVFLIAGMFLLTALSWCYILYLYRQMYPMNMDALFFAMPMTAHWTAMDFILLFLMWFVMMIAMMTPSVAPVVLIFAMVNRKNKGQKNPVVPSIYFLSGYFIVWAGFSLLATLLQWILQTINWLNPEMLITNRILGGVILLVAGLFQFSALKRKCLQSCCTPVNFIHSHWKEGKHGALKMGMVNGTYCLGCCWILMILLFVSGIMNILWISLIALFVLLEKLLPQAKWVSWIAGGVLIIYGALVLIRFANGD